MKSLFPGRYRAHFEGLKNGAHEGFLKMGGEFCQETDHQGDVLMLICVKRCYPQRGPCRGRSVEVSGLCYGGCCVDEGGGHRAVEEGYLCHERGLGFQQGWLVHLGEERTRKADFSFFAGSDLSVQVCFPSSIMRLVVARAMSSVEWNMAGFSEWQD